VCVREHMVEEEVAAAVVFFFNSFPARPAAFFVFSLPSEWAICAQRAPVFTTSCTHSNTHTMFSKGYCCDMRGESWKVVWRSVCECNDANQFWESPSWKLQRVQFGGIWENGIPSEGSILVFNRFRRAADTRKRIGEIVTGSWVISWDLFGSSRRRQRTRKTMRDNSIRGRHLHNNWNCLFKVEIPV